MFIHEKAICESKNIGANTNVWAFAHILPNAVVGGNCNICDGVFIENDVIVGSNVTIKCGVQLWDGITVSDNVFIGPNVTFTNDRTPRSKQYPEEFLKTTVELGASIGANATILPGITIGKYAMIGAGAVVTRDVPPYATVVGNPARIINYNAGSHPTNYSHPIDRHSYDKIDGSYDIGIGDSKLISLPSFTDMRGSLVACEHASHLPFNPMRTFMVHSVQSDRVRGEHAHIECEQFLVAVSGQLSVVLDDGTFRKEIILDSPSRGLYIPSGIWGIQYKFTDDAVLLVYASHEYCNEDYIRDYNDFLEFVENKDVS